MKQRFSFWRSAISAGVCFLSLSGVLTLNAIFPVPAAAEEEAYEPLQFTVHTQTVGPVTVKLGKMDVVSELETVQTLPVTVSSTSEKALSAVLTFTSIDTIMPTDENGNVQQTVTRRIELPAGGSVETEFTFKALPGTYSAHYPLHVKCTFPNGERETLVHAVRVIETNVPQIQKQGSETVVKIGGVSLLDKPFRAFRSLDGKMIGLPNFDGRDPGSSANYHLAAYTAGGVSRTCRNAHPPYRPYGGGFFAEYDVQLPNEPGLSMSYGACVRVVLPPEPPTDGVTFRFWGRNAGEDETKQILLEEFHTASTEWVDRTFSLEKFAGQKMKLTVEIHPGPKNNTTCDGCYLSGLVINTARGKNLVSQENAVPQETFTLPLDEEFTAWITPGPNGLLDAQIALGDPKKPESFVTFRGISLAVGAQPLNSAGAVYTKLPKLEKTADGKLRFTATLLSNDEELPIQINISAENGMLVFDVPKENPAELANFSFHPTDQKISRVYWGHGFVAEAPKNFRIGMGGHDLAASHIGIDYANGTSLVMGASNAPAAMVCDGEKDLCTLEMSSWFKLALVPDRQNAFRAAFKYRKQNTWLPKTGPGVERKRGRLTFDVWGGKYAHNTQELQKAFQYGVTDSLFIKHVWQCWGYDVRLPDIWNTNPDDPRNLVLSSLGTCEELQELAKTCAKAGVPFGIHDNYIDFYPDAEGFTYDRIDFHANGTPRKAWINHGAGVQSYQWRPDLFKPFLLRNLALDRKYLPTMDAYFVDVFTSANVYDYWDRDGNFHPRTQTAACWKDCFETIAEGLSHEVNGKKEPAITVSEAGSDGLLGSISGADCQWMLIDPEKGGAWRRHVPCENWSRTPWFAAVNHTNYSRHGAGYADRYRALRDPHLHGIMSDDYISAEILGGLDLMVDLGTIFSGSVRKHYLAQHFVRSIADQEIENVEFLDGLRRQRVTWTNGMTVYVNRGEGNWSVQGYTLPKYGFVIFDANGNFVSGIVRNPANRKEVAEFSQRPDGTFYLNGRGKALVDLLPIQPTMKSAKVLEEGRAFEVVTNWKCDAPAPKDLAIFAHVFEPRRGYGFTPTGWYDGYSCSIPTSQWGTSEETRNIETGAGHVFRIPEGTRNGKYHVMVGLYDHRGNGHRAALMGEFAQDNRYSVAEFEIREGRIVGEIRPVAISESVDDFSRLLGNRTPAEYRGVSTLGALYVKPMSDGLEILPLPSLPEFDVTVKGKVKRILFDGESVPFQQNGASAAFRVKVEDAKVYRVEFEK